MGVGAICGALCRHQIGKVATEHISKDPNLKHLSGWHTAGINVIGSFVLGGVFSTPLVNNENHVMHPPSKPPTNTSTIRKAMSNNISQMNFAMTPRMKLLLGVGFCGSFTTFSTFSVDLVNMMSKGEMTKACSYLMVNNVGGVVAAAAGMMLMKKVLRAK